MAQLSSINSGGIVTLGDGARWRVAPADLAIARAWPVGSEIEITDKQEAAAIWPCWAINRSNGERVSVTRSAAMF
jgi:hypothetical protein